MSTIFNEQDFENFDTRFRTNFFNSIVGFRALHLVGTQNAKNQTNLAAFSSIFHMGSNPAYFGMLFRPSDDVPRHTLANILETGFYTFNHINQSNFKKAHQTSAKYSSEISEFETCGFEEYYLPNFFAPFVKEANVQVGLQFVEKHEMSFNKTTLVVGKVIMTSVSESYIGTDGFIDVLQAGSMASVGIDGYAFVDKFTRMSYAKVGQTASEI
ncbi:MAG: flavin reductase family protein [Cytophagales bacterium]